MYQHSKSTGSGRKILLVWDGTVDYLWHADHCVAHNQPANVVVIHAMPHERIYSIGMSQEQLACQNSVEDLRTRFAQAISRTNHMRHLHLEFVFGDRLEEIIRYAREVDVDTILLPKFRQSGFSRWIHGDLNEEIVKRTSCQVLFLELEFGKMSGEESASVSTKPALAKSKT